MAGPDGGIDVASGGSVTLEVEGPENDDLWGNNVTYAWAPPAGTTVTYTDGTTANSPRPAFIVPATGENVTHAFRLTATGGGGVAATSSVNVRVAAGPRVENVEFVGTPRREDGGRPVYAQSEFIEVALRFDRAVTVDTAGGTPSVALTVGTAQKTAGYRRGTDSRQLVFGYRVVSADRDSDGVDLVENSLALNGAEIVGVSDNGVAAPSHAALAGGANRGVAGNELPQGLGICGRSPAVQAAILERIPTATRCTQVSGTQLRAITGTLDVSAQASAHGHMTALKAGDFTNLEGVTALDLDNHAIRVFPAGIFDPLTALTELSIAYNQTQAGDRLATLPAGLFDELTNLTTLRLEHNDLETLPGPHLPAAGKPHDTDPQRQSRQRDVPARGGSRAGGRDRREGRGPGEAGRRCRWSLGQQPGLFVGQGHGNDGGPVGDEYPDADLDRAGARGGGGTGVRADGDRKGHEPDRDGQRDGAGRGGGSGFVRRAGLDAGRRGQHLQERREDRGRGHLLAAGYGHGDGNGEGHARPDGGDEHSPGGVCPGHGHERTVGWCSNTPWCRPIGGTDS